jgi:predicted dehydrogenase/threonine dehydrogenase-like Zn-dependent dehydrogenase
MRQVLQNYRTGEVRVDEVPAPALRSGAVLVANRYSLISAGTERMKVETGKMSLVGKARSRPDLVKKVLKTLQTEGIGATYRKVMARLESPSPLGYSCAGEVIAVGSEVVGVQVGDRVACAGAEHAHHAEIVCVPQNLVALIPDGVPYEHAAFTTVGAIALHGVRQADVQLGDSVVIIGLGLVGLLTVQLLKASGARVFGIDVNPARCELAQQLGADRVALRADDVVGLVRDFTHGYGADVVMLTAGGSTNDPIELAGELARDRGKVVVVGLLKMDVPQRLYYEKELTVLLSRSYGPGRYDPVYEEMGIDYPIGYVRWTERENMREFLRLLAERKVQVEPLITHRYPIERAAEAYNLLASPEGGKVIGALIEYPQTTETPRRTVQARTPSATKQATVRLGVIGAGNFATGTLLPLLKGIPDVAFVGVCTARGYTAKGVADKFGFQFATSDPAEIFENPDINAILIATRHDSHAAYAIRAMRAGKPAFLEKPLAITLDQLQEVEQVWRETGGHVLVGYNRRFSPFVRQIAEHFRNRTEPLSILYRVNAGPLEQGHWMRATPEGGSRVVSEGCHFIDVMMFLTNSLPKRVCAAHLRSYEPDTAQLVIEFEDGSIGTLYYLTTGDPTVPKEYLEVHGAGRSAILRDFRELELVAGGKHTTHKTAGQDKGHKNELQAFVDAVKGGTEMPIPLEWAIANTRITLEATLPYEPVGQELR